MSTEDRATAAIQTWGRSELMAEEEQKKEKSVDEQGEAHVTRRHFLQTASVLVGGVGLVEPAEHRPGQGLSDPTKRQGKPPLPYGQRSRFETAERTFFAPKRETEVAVFTPLQDLHGSITPSSLHFGRHHAGVPEIDPAHHQLLIHGLVDRPLIFSVDELKRFPSVSRTYFLECSGNGGLEQVGIKGQSLQEIHGLTSCSEWTGVPLRAILDEVGVKTGASWILAEGSDGAMMTRSVPLEKCLDDVLVAYGQNGQMLRPEQGYPLRLLVPGWEGNINVKWLRRLKLVDQPYQTREETSKYTDLLPDGTARQFSFVMEAKSVITFPSGAQRLPAPGYYEIRGLAWSGRGRISQVEASVDDGKTWTEAELQKPILSMSHTRFRLPWRWSGQETVMSSRCFDETGADQPTREAWLQQRGEHSIYHYNAIQRWRITADGQVHNA